MVASSRAGVGKAPVEFLLVELEESVLIRTYLVDVDVVEPGIDELLYRLEVTLGFGPTGDDLGYVVLRQHLDGIPRSEPGAAS